jgi:TRAP-type C4-dicarboxylate transport system permease small subunit
MSLQRGLRLAQAAEMAVAVAALLAAAAALVADLLGREVFGQGIFGAQRAAVHFVFLSGMLGFVLAVGSGAHLRLKATDVLLPARWTPRIERAGCVFSALLLFGLAGYAARFTLQTHSVGERSVTLGLPIWPLQAVMVYAFASAGLRYLAYAWSPAARPREAEAA